MLQDSVGDAQESMRALDPTDCLNHEFHRHAGFSQGCDGKADPKPLHLVAMCA